MEKRKPEMTQEEFEELMQQYRDMGKPNWFVKFMAFLVGLGFSITVLLTIIRWVIWAWSGWF